MEMTIRTNNVPRFTIDAWELTANERDQFDYLDWSGIEAGTDSATFFRYRGELYDLGDFEMVTDSMHSFEGWHGYQSDSFFSGILIRLSSDWETVIVGRYSS